MSLQELIQQFDNIHSYFDKPDFLLDALKELDNMIGMGDAKLYIAEQLQSFVVNKVYNKTESGRKHCLIVGPPGVGKCLHPLTNIIMYDGKIKCIGFVKIGDLIMGDDSTPRTVLSTTSGKDKMYEIRNNNTIFFKCNEPHILTLVGKEPQILQKGNRYILEYTIRGILQYEVFNNLDLCKAKMETLKSDIFDISLKDFIARTSIERKYCYLFHQKIEFQSKELKYKDPYIVGWWTGGKTFEDLNSNQISKLDDFDKTEYLKSFIQYLETENIGFKIYEKVLDDYKYNDSNVRNLYLSGIIDASNNSPNNKYVKIKSKDVKYLKEVKYIALSLGHKANIKKHHKEFILSIFKNLNTLKTQIYNLQDKENIKSIKELITGEDDEFKPIIKSDKLCREKFNYKYIGIGDYVGFELDKNGRFLLEDFKITHNTTLSKILCKIWIGIGYIKKNREKKLRSMSDFQDAIIAQQKEEIRIMNRVIKDLKNYIINCKNNCNLTQDTISKLVNVRSRINNDVYQSLYGDISSGHNTLNQIEKFTINLNYEKPSYVGMGVDIENKKIHEGEDNLPFYKFNRSDVVGKYVGHSTHLARDALNSALGGVAYFDEAYDICHREGDFGEEALTAINEYMDEHENNIIVVFSGYEDKIRDKLFSVQPGLESRFQQIIRINGYTSDELLQIFKLDMKKLGWEINIDLKEVFEENHKYFHYYGRDVNSLAHHVDRIHNSKIFESIMKGERPKKVINDLGVIEEALLVLKNKKIQEKEEDIFKLKFK